jgi:succinate-acetate transporter protein
MATDTDRAGGAGMHSAEARDATAGRDATATEYASEGARVIADPAPLGLAGFGLTTLLLSLINSGIMPKTTEPIVFGMALAYGGLGQLLAGMWEFRKGNTFGATAFASFGAFWISFWAFVTFYAKSVPTADAGKATGWYLILWGIFTTLMWFASFRTTAALVALFALLAATFYFLGAGALAGSSGIGKIGGVLGIITAVVALYTALAGVLTSTFGRAVLPNPSLRRV